jgi:hypothetical protein
MSINIGDGALAGDTLQGFSGWNEWEAHFLNLKVPQHTLSGICTQATRDRYALLEF